MTSAANLKWQIVQTLEIGFIVEKRIVEAKKGTERTKSTVFDPTYYAPIHLMHFGNLHVQTLDDIPTTSRKPEERIIIS